MSGPTITEPGVYQLPAADYFADPVQGGSLTSSGARTLIRACPAVFRHEREHGRPHRAAFDFGHAAHALVLGVGDPIRALPFDDRRSKAFKEAEQEARADGCTPLLAADAERVERMAAALREHPVAGPLFARPGRAEQAHVWRDVESGVWCRSMIDWLPDVPAGARKIIVDYKTTASARPAEFAKSIATYGYDQQADFYTAAVDAFHPCDEPPQFVFVAQEKEPPHLVTVGYLGPRPLERGRVLNRKALDLYRVCTDLDIWPGYGDELVEFDLPGWAAREFELAWDAGTYDLWSDAA